MESFYQKLRISVNILENTQKRIVGVPALVSNGHIVEPLSTVPDETRKSPHWFRITDEELFEESAVNRCNVAELRMEDSHCTQRPAANSTLQSFATHEAYVKPIQNFLENIFLVKDKILFLSSPSPYMGGMIRA